MINEKILDRLSKTVHVLNYKRSFCLRSRFSENSCRLCVDVCRSGSLSLNGHLVYDPQRCLECLLCAGSCPAGAIDINDHNPCKIISALRKVGSPVLGCSRSESAHERLHCLGCISEEEMIVFAFFLQEPLQLNLTGCMDCKKGHIRDVLEQRLGAVGERFSPDISERIIMVTDKSELRFSPSQLDRRSFFQLLRKGAMQEMAKFIIDKEEKRPVYATVKRLPLKRELLNMVCRNHNAIERKRLINNYYYSVSIKGECDLCGACGGVCPTGALKVQWDDPIGLYFSSYLCIGCGLCVDICEDKKIQLTPQVSDDIFQTIKIGSLSSNLHDEPNDRRDS